MWELITDLESDAILLDRFARLRDEAAFSRLVTRHGPAVLRACRRVLSCEHDVQDVFQATFLVLAGKAGNVGWGLSVGAWLRSVAIRLALHARARSGMRRNRERPLAEAFPESHHPIGDPDREIERRELRRVLDDALGQLPEKYRAPVVLCYLEGMTNDEAARELGWPAGSMSRRLERARCLLRRRLARTGLLILVLACGATLIARRALELESSLAGFPALARSRPGVLPPAHAEIDADGILSRLVRGHGDLPGREQIEALARISVRTAEQMLARDARENRGLWRFETGKLKETAEGLGRAVRMGDRVALLGTARRLDAACIHCHEVFRPGSSVSGPRSLPRIE
jgi:RNA polymerase sigma factor (sigma-70 family)